MLWHLRLRRIIREASSESVNSFVSSTGVGSIQPASSTSKADSQLSRIGECCRSVATPTMLTVVYRSIGWTRPSIASISNEKGNTLGQEQLYANVFSILAVDSVGTHMDSVRPRWPLTNDFAHHSPYPSVTSPLVSLSIFHLYLNARQSHHTSTSF